MFFLRLVPSILFTALLVLVNLQRLNAEVFVAEVGEKSNQDSDAYIHYGESITETVSSYFSGVKGERVRYYVLTSGTIKTKILKRKALKIVEGFNVNGTYGTASIDLLLRRKRNLIDFSERFPQAVEGIKLEVEVIDEVLVKLKAGYRYLSGKWESKIFRTIKYIGYIILGLLALGVFLLVMGLSTGRGGYFGGGGCSSGGGGCGGGCGG